MNGPTSTPATSAQAGRPAFCASAARGALAVAASLSSRWTVSPSAFSAALRKASARPTVACAAARNFAKSSSRALGGWIRPSSPTVRVRIGSAFVMNGPSSETLVGWPSPRMAVS